MKKVYILSGAGLSAESGIRTFRDPDGLWEEYSVEDVCSVEGYAKDRQKVLDFYDARRADLATKEPNIAHRKLAQIKNRYPHNIFMLTQNVDNMLERAGCKDVIHLHGTLTDLRCEDCGAVFEIGYESQKGAVCPKYESSRIRHNIVMFGEAAPMYRYLQQLQNEADMLVVIGTSGQVIDVAYLAQLTPYSILNNLEMDGYIEEYFTKVYIDKATNAVDSIVQDIEQFING